MSESADVIVIGGGLAGLTAARELKKNGVKVHSTLRRFLNHREVLLLEARDRLGGRTQTIEVENHKFDVGGQWFGETQKKALALIKEFNLTLVQQHMTGLNTLELNKRKVLYEGLIPWRLPSSWFPSIPAIFTLLDTDLLMKKIDSLSLQVPLDRPWEAEKAKEWDSVSLRTFEDQTCWTTESRQMIDIANEVIMASDTKEVSLLYFLFYIHSSGGSISQLSESHAGGAQEFRIDEGAQEISNRLGESFGLENIRLNSPVRRIEQGNFGVTVRTDNATYNAKFVICAIAPALANRIVYSPPMPPLRDILTQRMPMGSVIKVLIFYKQPWWRTKGLNGFGVTNSHAIEDPVLVIMDDCSDDLKVSALVGFMVGERARIWADKTSEQRKEVVIKQYARLFNCEEALHPTQYIDKNWMEEEFSRGCFVGIMAPGTLTTCGKALREPVGRIHWAGTETAYNWCGYMDGAIESGERAAAEVLKELK